MATHDYVIANGTGAAVRSDLNGALAAIVSQNSSATEPSPSYAYQRWADTTAGVMKMRNGANNAWITLYQLDGEWTSIAFENGTAAAPSIYFKDSGTDTGIYSPGADQVGISTGGTARITVDGSGNVNIDSNTLYIDAANNRVGIGTSSPSSALHVVGTTTLNGTQSFTANSTTGSYGTFQHNGTIVGDIGTANQAISSGSNTDFAISTRAATSIVFGINTAEKARLDSSGRLLVGTSTSEGAFFNASGVNHLIEAQAQYYMQAWVSNNNSNASGAILTVARSRGTTAGSKTVVQSDDTIGVLSFQGADGSQFVEAANIKVEVDGTPGADDMPGRLVFSTTADGASSPTERMRINNVGDVTFSTNIAAIATASSSGDLGNAAARILGVSRNTTTSRSINANGTINASGTDYAEYMTKAGDFTLAKGGICGVTADGLLTLNYSDAVSFVVKSTNPSYVGGDTWGAGFDDDPEGLEVARQTVDRIAFAGQVPVNVMGATPGQYIVPVETADNGIEGIAKSEADLTLAEYMRAVGKVIAIEDDGRARIIVKVA